MKEKILLLFLMIFLAFPFSASAFSYEKTISEWVETAKAADAEFLSVSTENIPDGNIICERPGEADLRLLSFAGAIQDTGMHPVYLIVKGEFYPTGTCLSASYGNGILYSHDVMDETEEDGEKFTVHRFILFRKFAASKEWEAETCTHSYFVTADLDASCLVRGVTKKVCEKCGDEKVTWHAPLGHIDDNGDSVCDRCGGRVYEEDVGSHITTELRHGGTVFTLNWTLVDENYDGGCLYIADTGIPVSLLGGYGTNTEYEKTGLFWYLSHDFANEHSVNGEVLRLFDEGGTTGYAQMLSAETAGSYRALMAAGDYVTRTGDGTFLSVLHTDGTESAVAADGDFPVRPAMILGKPTATEGAKAHWSEGDQVTRGIDGVEYTFTCVDENYSDIRGNHTQSALFLMDDVIPAGYGGEYRWEIDDGGHYTNTWVPGPVACFGEDNNYKYSHIRAFLDRETVFTASEIVIGQPNAFTGSTEENRFSQTTDRNLRPYPIGYQQMTAKLFILSLEEAVKYRKYLWRFGSPTENPEAVMEATCASYWLRSPAGTSGDYQDTGLCYVVDLAAGNIHPESIKPAGGTGDPYLDTQTTVGIRPAFTLPNI